MGFLPTSRGSITLKSADPADPPVIDPNFLATEADRFVMREGWRLLSRLMFETPQGKDLVAEEIVPEGHKSLESDAPDDLIDARIRMGGLTGSHFAGTASMGSVVDGSLKVRGTQGLRLVDASVVSESAQEGTLSYGSLLNLDSNTSAVSHTSGGLRYCRAGC